MRTAVERGIALSELSEQDLAQHSLLLEQEYYDVLSSGSSLESKISSGGTASVRVIEQLEAARGALAAIDPESA